MFEDMTFENILSQMLENVKGDVDKREGSIIYDALAPVAMESAQMYADMDILLQECFADSASYYYLIKRAAEGTEFAALDPHLEGPTALAVSKDDATAPARILAEFAKTAPKLELKASVVEGTYYDQAGTQVIATIPSREVLLGKLLGSIQSPITNLARVLNQIAEKNGGAAEA